MLINIPISYVNITGTSFSQPNPLYYRGNILGDVVWRAIDSSTMAGMHRERWAALYVGVGCSIYIGVGATPSSINTHPIAEWVVS